MESKAKVFWRPSQVGRYTFLDENEHLCRQKVWKHFLCMQQNSFLFCAIQWGCSFHKYTVRKLGDTFSAKPSDRLHVFSVELQIFEILQWTSDEIFFICKKYL